MQTRLRVGWFVSRRTDVRAPASSLLMQPAGGEGEGHAFSVVCKHA
jgi:hypothetical protein